MICIGSVKLRTSNDKLITLTRVRYIPSKRNLIFLGALDGACSKCTAECGCMYVYKNDKLLMSGSKKSGIYVLDDACCNVASKSVNDV